MFNDNPQTNPKKLFVGNLPWSATQDEIADLFAQHGEVTSVNLITDRMSGRSKGIAFVEYKEEAEASAAKEALNNYELDGRNIHVDVARPPKPRTDFGGGGYNRNDRRGGDRR